MSGRVKTALIPFVGVVGAIVLAAACGLLMIGNSGLERAVRAASPGEGIAILDRAGITGDKLCVLGPYTGREEFLRTTGVDWPEVERADIYLSDLVDLVAVIDGDRVVAWTTVERFVAPLAVGTENGCKSRP